MANYLFLFIFLFISNVSGLAQAWNPFDIKNRNPEDVEDAYQASPRMEDEKKLDTTNPYSVISAEKEIDVVLKEQLVTEEIRVNYQDSLGNPFEVIRVPEAAYEWELLEETIAEEGQSSFLFVVHLIILIGLGILVSLFRNVIPHIFRSLLNSNFLKLMQRTSNETMLFRLRVFYFFFFINGGVFLFQILQHFDEAMIDSEPKWLFYCVMAVAGFFLLKHILLSYIAYFFPPKKEAKLLSFMFIVFNSFLGLVLVPINILLAFGGTEMTGILLFIGIVLWIGIYLIKQLRAIILSTSIWVNNVFHFFLYLCAVEIAPIGILWKLSQSMG